MGFALNRGPRVRRGHLLWHLTDIVAAGAEGTFVQIVGESIYRGSAIYVPVNLLLTLFVFPGSERVVAERGYRVAGLAQTRPGAGWR